MLDYYYYIRRTFNYDIDCGSPTDIFEAFEDLKKETKVESYNSYADVWTLWFSIVAVGAGLSLVCSD